MIFVLMTSNAAHAVPMPRAAAPGAAQVNPMINYPITTQSLVEMLANSSAKAISVVCPHRSEDEPDLISDLTYFPIPAACLMKKLL